MYDCPVCGLDTLDIRPYELWPPPVGIQLRPPYYKQLGRPSYDVCIRCSFEFGFDDDPGNGPGSSFEDYRAEWIANGRPWLSKGYKEEYRSRPRTPRPIIIRALPPGGSERAAES